MDGKRLGIRVLGWLSVVAGNGLALLLIRGVYLGTTYGFRANRSQIPWIALAYLLFFALAVYLFALGRRALLIAKSNPRPRFRFGWGRIVVGTVFLYSSAADHLHLTPAGPIKHLAPTNETQAVTMKATAVVIALGCLALILSGIWRGFRPQRAATSA